MKHLSLVLASASTILLASCTETEQTQTKENFKVVKPIIKDTIYTKEYVAQINAIQNVEIRSKLRGFIENIYVDEGQRVRKGQTIFAISNKTYEQSLQKAKAITKSALADLKLAEIELENAKKLLQKNIIAKTEFDFAMAKVETMKAKLEEAESDEAQAKLFLSFTEVKAPFDGTINRLPYKMGSLVEEGTLLTSITNTEFVYTYFNVSESEYLDLMAERKNTVKKKNTDEVNLILANGDLYNYTGVIETSESEFDASSGNLAFRAKFRNDEGLLKHGGNGKIVIEKTIKNAMLIPQKSTFEIQDKLYVYVVKKDSSLEQRNIISNIRLPHLFVVERGLNKDEQILFEGASNVKAGDKIVPQIITFK
jgi:membrane fusion protein (multidrug efflux system)